MLRWVALIPQEIELRSQPDDQEAEGGGERTEYPLEPGAINLLMESPVMTTLEAGAAIIGGAAVSL